VIAGRLAHEKACGMPVGTRIDVEHLFEPVPARRKFLKSDRTEAAHIVSCVRLYALACPSASFALYEDGREVFRSPQCPALADRVAEIFGRQAVEGLVPVDGTEAGMRLSGLIGRPGVGRSTRHDMVAFVNSRPVDSRTVNGALLESYREALPQGRYPVAFVFLECDPAQVDVNVHPAKREVRFRSESLVRGFIIRSVLGRLRECSGGAAPAPPALAQLGSPGALPSPFQAPEADRWAPAAAPPQVMESPAHAQDDRRREGEGAPAWRFLGAALSGYALFETAGGLVLLDRRAAHERIWYERLKEQFSRDGVPVQRLLLPVSLELNPVSSALLADHLAFFRRHGLEISEFGRNFFRVEALPAWLEPGDAEGFVRDLLGAAREGRIPASDIDLARDELARIAAAKAVRLPAAIGEGAALALVRELFETSTPGSSPAGRPTYVELNHSELARRFHR